MRIDYFVSPGKKAAVFAIITVIAFSAFSLKNKETTIYIIGDSTVADYSLDIDYHTKRYPAAGWGQMLKAFFIKDSLKLVRGILNNAKEVKIDNRAKAGRSSRTFFQEGRWADIYKSLKKGDVVMIQFGHNDSWKEKPERYVNVEGFKEYLRLFSNQTKEKGAVPVLLTPVTRNYPWKDGELMDSHGEYADAVKAVANELQVKVIDLNRLSRAFFTKIGEDNVSGKYFMNLKPGQYVAFPNGLNDNYHFQIEGAREVSRLIFNAMKKF